MAEEDDETRRGHGSTYGIDGGTAGGGSEGTEGTPHSATVRGGLLLTYSTTIRVAKQSQPGVPRMREEGAFSL